MGGGGGGFGRGSREEQKRSIYCLVGEAAQKLAVCREIIDALAQQEQWPTGWAWDGGKSIYTASSTFPEDGKTSQVRLCSQQGYS